jgi:hypothetical protein
MDELVNAVMLPTSKDELRAPVAELTVVVTEAVEAVKVGSAVVATAYTLSPTGRCAAPSLSNQFVPET